jgi:hypothetical protein
MDPNQLETAKKTMALAAAVAPETTIAMVVDARTTDTRQPVLLLACHPFLPSVSRVTHSKCQLSRTACRCSLPASPSLVNSSRRIKPLSSHRLQATALRR